jgi:hypothetical protein
MKPRIEAPTFCAQLFKVLPVIALNQEDIYARQH